MRLNPIQKLNASSPARKRKLIRPLSNPQFRTNANRTNLYLLSNRAPRIQSSGQLKSLQSHRKSDHIPLRQQTSLQINTSSLTFKSLTTMILRSLPNLRVSHHGYLAHHDLTRPTRFQRPVTLKPLKRSRKRNTINHRLLPKTEVTTSSHTHLTLLKMLLLTSTRHRPHIIRRIRHLKTNRAHRLKYIRNLHNPRLPHRMTRRNN